MSQKVTRYFDDKTGWSDGSGVSVAALLRELYHDDETTKVTARRRTGDLLVIEGTLADGLFLIVSGPPPAVAQFVAVHEAQDQSS